MSYYLSGSAPAVAGAGSVMAANEGGYQGWRNRRRKLRGWGDRGLDSGEVGGYTPMADGGVQNYSDSAATAVDNNFTGKYSMQDYSAPSSSYGILPDSQQPKKYDPAYSRSGMRFGRYGRR